MRNEMRDEWMRIADKRRNLFFLLFLENENKNQDDLRFIFARCSVQVANIILMEFSREFEKIYQSFKNAKTQPNIMWIST